MSWHPRSLRPSRDRRPLLPREWLPRTVLALVLLWSTRLLDTWAAPPRPPHDVWLEGESCSDHDFTVIGRDSAFQTCYGKAILQLQTHQAAPSGGYHATFRPRLPQAGWWEVMLAVTRTGVAHLSPFSVQVRGYADRRIADLPAHTPYGKGAIFAWTSLGRFELDSDQASITVRCTERRKTEGDYLVYIDAIALRRVPEPRSERRWIAGPQGAEGCVFSATFDLAEPVTAPFLSIVSQGTFKAQLNGMLLGTGTGWHAAAHLPLDGKMRTGENLLDIEVEGQERCALLAWLTAAGPRGSRTGLLHTNSTWTVRPGSGPLEPAHELGGPTIRPWGDMDVQPHLRIPVGKLPIPIKTGNLSVDLIMAVAQGKPRPPPAARPEFDQYREIGGISCVEDYLCWLPLEPETGRHRWEFFERNCAELEERGMKYAVYPWLHFAPKWVTATDLWEPLQCVEHGESTWAPSIWSPKTLAIFDRFYAELRQHFGERVREVFVSMICDYGEIGYPVGMANWVVPSDHVHPGYWCADPLAKTDFRAHSLARHGTLEQLNLAWGSDFATMDAIDFPAETATDGPAFGQVQAMPAGTRAQTRRRWLDFAEWYLNAMVAFAGKAVAVSRRHFPDAPHEIKIGFGQEPVKFGADYTAYVARSAQDRYTVRSTHGKLPFYFYRRFSSAAKHYGVPLVTEPPSDVSREEEVERIFKDATSGTTEFFDYPGNILGASDLFSRFGRYMEGQHSLTDVAFFFPTTDHRLRPGQGNPKRLMAACAAARELFDWDIVDERLVLDGALARYRTLLVVEGNVTERAVLQQITGWVEAGGILLWSALGPVETVEGDTTWDRRLFVDRETLPEYRDATDAALATLVDGRIKTTGTGATLLLPLEPRQVPGFARLAAEVVHQPAGIVPGRPGAPRLDGGRHGVWAALMRNRILLHNTTDRDVRTTVTVEPEALARQGALRPSRADEVTVDMPPRSLASIELPGLTTVVP